MLTTTTLPAIRAPRLLGCTAQPLARFPERFVWAAVAVAAGASLAMIPRRHGNSAADSPPDPVEARMRNVTAWFTLLLPPLILLADMLVMLAWGYHSTITAVVRQWASESAWAEAMYVVAALALYLHLFRGWL